MIGVGRWGRNFLRILDARCDLAVVCGNGSPGGRAWLSENFPRIPYSSSFGEVVADSSIEAVFIATPIDTHAALVRRALRAGKHVFVEKPLTTSEDEGRALNELARDLGRTLGVGHIFLHSPAFTHLEAVIADDPIVHATMSWSKLGTFDSDLWWNLGSHFASLAIALFGDGPILVKPLMQQGLVTLCDVVAAQLQFDGGRECSLWIDRCSPLSSRAITVLTKSGRVFAWHNDSLAELDSDRVYRSIELMKAEPLDLEIEAFLLAAQGGPVARANGEHAWKTAAVVAKLIEAGSS